MRGVSFVSGGTKGGIICGGTLLELCDGSLRRGGVRAGKRKEQQEGKGCET